MINLRKFGFRMSGKQSDEHGGKPMAADHQQALDTARELVEQALGIAGEAGIDPHEVLAPHCGQSSAGVGDGIYHDEQGLLLWGGDPVHVDNGTEGLFEMCEPDDDPAQQPSFLVTQSTADLVHQDFARYKPALGRMVERWRQEKERTSPKGETEEDAQGESHN
jgi:hypothetical protein